jgi:hypothetical protein
MTPETLLSSHRPALLRIARKHVAPNVHIFISIVCKKSYMSIKEQPHVQTQ